MALSGGGWLTFLRLFAVQGAWNHERMLGTGIGYAAAPLLEPLKREAPGRYEEAVARSAEFFNCQPFLAGLALGAEVRAELDGVPGDRVVRLRSALCGPLGALGDQLFWTGFLPGLLALAMIAVVLGVPWLGILGFLVIFNGIRSAVGAWSLSSGLQAGMRVGSVLSHSWLPRAVGVVGLGAGFAMGVALPLVAVHLAGGRAVEEVVLVAAVAVTGLVVLRRTRARVTGVRLTLGLVGLLLLFQWIGT